MDPYERSQLGDAVKEESFKKDDMIIKQGEDGDVFFLISEGTAEALIKQPDGSPKKVKEYKVGDYFGERALIINETRAASILVTSDKCVVLTL